MIIYIVLAVVTCLLAFWIEPARNTQPNNQTRGIHPFTKGEVKNAYILLGIFLLLFGVSACRIAIGHDYWEYTEMFDLIRQNRHTSAEPGFILLVKLCQAVFGYEGKRYIIIFAIMSFGTVLFYLKGLFRLSENFGMTFFLFTVFGYYLSSYNSIRYYLALSVAFFAVSYLLRKEYGKFVLLILLAATFHMSVLVVLLCYPLALIPWKKWMIPVLSALVASLIFLPGVYRKIIFIFYPYYENSIYDTAGTSTIQIARCVAVLVFALVFYKSALKDNKVNKFYFAMNVEALILYCCCSFIPVISRIGFYLNIFQILLIPNVIGSIKNKKLRTVITILTVIAGCAYYAYFLHAIKDDGTRIVPYLNWIMN